MAYGTILGQTSPQPDLSNYVTNDELNSKNYVTETELNSKGFLTSSALNGYATQSWVNSQGFAKTSQIPNLPSGFGSIISFRAINYTANLSGTYLLLCVENLAPAICFNTQELDSVGQALTFNWSYTRGAQNIAASAEITYNSSGQTRIILSEVMRCLIVKIN